MHDDDRLSTPAHASGKTPLVAMTPDAAADSKPAAKSQRLGSMLVLVVVMLYVGSGVMIQMLFDDMRYEKPFFFSYISVSLCSVYLLGAGWISCQQRCQQQWPRHAYSKVQQGSHVTRMSPMQLLRPALHLAPSYFCLNYTYFFSLDLTSVSSTMVLSASTGVWTLLFSRMLLGQPLTRLKLAVVAFSLLGMTLVTTAARGSHGGSHGGSLTAEEAAAASAGMSGDVLALMSAAASGVYMVLLPVTLPEQEGQESVHMPTLFGMMGVVCAIALLPLFPLLHYGGIERFELPPSHQATLSLLVNAATSTVLPDLLLAQAVMMTSPLVATLGLSMMIPLSVFTDYLRGVSRLSPQFFVGTFCIFVCYLLESWAEAPEEEEDDEDVTDGHGRRRAASAAEGGGGDEMDGDVM